MKEELEREREKERHHRAQKGHVQSMGGKTRQGRLRGPNSLLGQGRCKQGMVGVELGHEQRTEEKERLVLPEASTRDADHQGDHRNIKPIETSSLTSKVQKLLRSTQFLPAQACGANTVQMARALAFPKMDTLLEQTCKQV